MVTLSNEFQKKNRISIKYITEENNKEVQINNFKINDDNKKVAILIQGPVQNDYIIDSINYYKKSFPKDVIVVSTWINQDQGIVKKIRDLGVIVLENIPPQNNGFLNLNLQIYSTFAGIKYIKENLDVKYLLRTRTDQRLKQENLRGFLLSLIDKFPCYVLNQNKRIITLQIYTNKYIPFHISDMFQFGDIDDLFKYWDVPLSKVNISSNEWVKISRHVKIKEEETYDYSEIYLTKNYLGKICEIQVPNDIYDYYQALASRFIIVNPDMVGFNWVKMYRFPNSNGNLTSNYLSQTLNFSEWFILYQNQEKIKDIAIDIEEKIKNKSRWIN